MWFLGCLLLEWETKETSMPDDKIKAGEPDRSRAASDTEYEVRRFARKYDLSQEYVRELIARVGNDRDELRRVARELRVAASIRQPGDAAGDVTFTSDRLHTIADQKDAPTIETTTEARGGVTGQNVRYVLAFGLAGVIIAFLIIALYFYGV
jgi:hypothetical protein